MIRVIGAGLGRTGTFSLKTALEQLEFGPCFHMSEMFELRDRASILIDASQGRQADWERLFDGFNATVDWPTCAFYAELADRYPSAKIILTTRDPERWHQSCMDTIAWRGEDSHATAEPSEDIVDQMIDTVIWRGTFDRRFDDKEHAISIFNRHNQEVIDTIPAERLLVFEVKDGWQPLCDFLGVPAPSDPFPHLNDTQSFRRDHLGIPEAAGT